VSNPIIEEAPTSEDELQSVLTEIFRSVGWTAIREYSPDHSNKRIDIYAEHDRYGTVGIETKHIRSNRDGKRLADAYVQITRDYWRKRYNREQILFWAVAPYFAPGKLPNTVDDQRISDFVRQFVTGTGVGLINCHKDTLTIQYSDTDLRLSIPIAGPYVDTYASRVDVEDLRSHVRELRQVRGDNLQ
jgi:hypothetical protein